MAINVDMDNMGEGGTREKETCVIPKGFQLCRLVSYVELGHHYPYFKGKHQVYDAGKNVGKPKDQEAMIQLVFEFTNATYTAGYPLCIKFSSPLRDTGDLINKLSVPRGVEEGWASRANQMKSNFVQALKAMQDSYNSKEGCMGDFVGRVFGCTVTHSLGSKADNDGNIPVYANMKLTSLVAPEFKHPVTGEVEKMDLPEQIGEYCSVFSWEEPTIEGWGKLPKYMQDYIMKANDYPGSVLDLMLQGYSEENPEEPIDENDIPFPDGPSIDDADEPIETHDDGVPVA